MSFQPASLPNDPIALKALVAQLQAQNAALSATVRVFEQHIANLQRKRRRNPALRMTGVA